ncbi:hypothetical protein FHS04_002833 [Mesoflavibacter sabulilitoris]|uniref:Uncharacterized protein n=1 Tax=Mesoflavibacter zeaxanthinifaciens subsp. sabulilitoris TaxID=1520893 RepID=A0A2T1NNR8_9FLAO|nr:hypothetical protein [Mesoflavibacter zeaxanthinifaciens]MBB3125289.1 hypothetical protein [Mesoflavibacter zeaxanthinifaciens subsp. sabulilitoris]PSG94524.1 hypothetical protein C7H61_00895 [Mesoflavibacter zeaxanthinifaciens subsp. sabulilitoris]
MKNLLKFTFVFIALLSFFNCENDDSVSDPIISEDIVLKSVLQLNLEANPDKTYLDFPFPVGMNDSYNSNTIIGCIFTEPYTSENSIVEAKLVNNNLNGTLTYEGETYSVGESIIVDELNQCIQNFYQSSFYYVGLETGTHEIEIEITTSRGTTYSIIETILFE